MIGDLILVLCCLILVCLKNETNKKLKTLICKTTEKCMMPYKICMVFSQPEQQEL